LKEQCEERQREGGRRNNCMLAMMMIMIMIMIMMEDCGDVFRAEMERKVR